ncbi:MAG: response regulator [Bacteroidales bacterium]|nr:response regulator [Bacteroidales bacterium]
MAIKILIVEDEILLAKDIEQSLLIAGYQVIGIASNHKKAKQLLNVNMPDLILCDINLRSKKTGIELITEIKKSHQLSVIYITAYSDEETIELANQTNPINYLTKPFNEKQLLTSVHLAVKYIEQKDSTDMPSQREISVINLLSKGYNSRAIAEELSISFNTVETHRKNILKRYQIKTSAELVYLAASQGWISH